MKNSPKTAWNPVRLDVRAFAEANGKLEGVPPLSAFARLHAEAAPDEHTGGDDVVRWQAQAEMREGSIGRVPSVWLHLQADTRISLTCQRCLGPVQTPLAVDRWFRFVTDEATAEAEDDDCEEDLLALEPRPNLQDVLEDELLMELPLVPMHDTCPVSVRLQGGEDARPITDGLEPERKNPFAALARLKK